MAGGRVGSVGGDGRRGVDGKPDENLDDLLRIDLVVKGGLVLVKAGQVVIPRHVPESLRKPAPPQDVR